MIKNNFVHRLNGPSKTHQTFDRGLGVNYKNK